MRHEDDDRLRRRGDGTAAVVGTSLAVGAVIGMGLTLLYDAVWGADAPAAHREQVSEEVLLSNPRSHVVRVRVAARGGARAELLDSSGAVLATAAEFQLSANQVRRVAAWRVAARSEGGSSTGTTGGVQLLVQKRDGCWAPWGEPWAADAGAGATQRLLPPVVLQAQRVVDVVCPVPRNYAPKLAAEHEEANACVVCLVNEADTQVMPCGHLGMCYACLVRSPDTTCPTCRREFNAVSYTYKA